MASPGHWKCGSQSPQSSLWLDRSDVARMVPLTGDFVGVWGLVIGWVRVSVSLGYFVNGKQWFVGLGLGFQGGMWGNIRLGANGEVY